MLLTVFQRFSGGWWKLTWETLSICLSFWLYTDLKNQSLIALKRYNTCRHQQPALFYPTATGSATPLRDSPTHTLHSKLFLGLKTLLCEGTGASFGTISMLPHWRFWEEVSSPWHSINWPQLGVQQADSAHTGANPLNGNNVNEWWLYLVEVRFAVHQCQLQKQTFFLMLFQ